MIQYQSEVIINRPAEEVYRLASDVARWDEWTEMTGTHLVSGQSLQVGSQVETTLKMGPMKQTMVFQLAELKENLRLGWKTVSKGALAWDADLAFEPQGPSSTRMVSSGQVRLNGLLKWLEPLLAGEIRNGEAKELVKFKQLAEARN
jgi:uncharacterized membrane protein